MDPIWYKHLSVKCGDKSRVNIAFSRLMLIFENTKDLIMKCQLMFGWI